MTRFQHGLDIEIRKFLKALGITVDEKVLEMIIFTIDRTKDRIILEAFNRIRDELYLNYQVKKRDAEGEN